MIHNNADIVLQPGNYSIHDDSSDLVYIHKVNEAFFIHSNDALLSFENADEFIEYIDAVYYKSDYKVYYVLNKHICDLTKSKLFAEYFELKRQEELKEEEEYKKALASNPEKQKSLAKGHAANLKGELRKNARATRIKKV
jgi:hypothetical protein